jgi:hypothetical protein
MARHSFKSTSGDRCFNIESRFYVSATFSCSDGSDWGGWFPRVEVAYNASRALGIEHTHFEADFGFSHEQPPDCMLPMRPSISIC